MRVLLIYPNVENSALPQLGLSSLIACLKQEGHVVDLLDFTYRDRNQASETLRRVLSEFDPELVGISIRSFEWEFVTSGILPVFADVDLPVIVGGPHPTAVPDEVMAAPEVYALVRGEGEAAMVDFTNTLAGGGDASKVDGVWVRTADGIARNEVRPPSQDLDSLPFPDWSLWDRRHFRSAHHESFKKGVKCIGAVESSRGCPYACPYCISPTLHKLYRGKGRYHREKSIDRLIAEILDKRERYGMDYVNFVDETFLLKDRRIEEFCEKWIRNVNLPFRLTTRPETVTDKRIRMIAEAGANVVCLGIESGDPEYRQNHLNRRYSQEQVHEAVNIIRRHGITSFGFFVIGMPGETRENIEQTYRLLNSLNLDHYMVTLCYPFKGTPFYDEAINDGLFVQEGNAVPNVWEATALSLPGLSQKRLLRLRYLVSYFGRRSPRWRPVMGLCERSAAAYYLWKAFRRVERKISPSDILD